MLMEEPNEPVPVQAACDIQTLTALMLGYQRPGLLAQIGRLQADASAVRLLEELVPAANTYLADFF
ncbi:sterol carrier protein domain-containing protein [Paenibacillus sp. y28]|uniref:sterol carrier protein domain-containing protein n=1 Tax=Paenibacillus sp. y28 TaxID=3129110 RepID=UPI00301A46EA